MSKKSEAIYTSKTKSEKKYTSKATLFTRIMAIFLAGLMFVGAISYTIYFIIGSRSVPAPAPVLVRLYTEE